MKIVFVVLTIIAENLVNVIGQKNYYTKMFLESVEKAIKSPEKKNILSPLIWSNALIL